MTSLTNPDRHFSARGLQYPSTSTAYPSPPGSSTLPYKRPQPRSDQAASNVRNEQLLDDSPIRKDYTLLPFLPGLLPSLRGLAPTVLSNLNTTDGWQIGPVAHPHVLLRRWGIAPPLPPPPLAVLHSVITVPTSRSQPTVEMDHGRIARGENTLARKWRAGLLREGGGAVRVRMPTCRIVCIKGEGGQGVKEITMGP